MIIELDGQESEELADYRIEVRGKRAIVTGCDQAFLENAERFKGRRLHAISDEGKEVEGRIWEVHSLCCDGEFRLDLVVI